MSHPPTFDEPNPYQAPRHGSWWQAAARFGLWPIFGVYLCLGLHIAFVVFVFWRAGQPSELWGLTKLLGEIMWALEWFSIANVAFGAALGVYCLVTGGWHVRLLASLPTMALLWELLGVVRLFLGRLW